MSTNGSFLPAAPLSCFPKTNKTIKLEVGEQNLFYYFTFISQLSFSVVSVSYISSPLLEFHTNPVQSQKEWLASQVTSRLSGHKNLDLLHPTPTLSSVHHGGLGGRLESPRMPFTIWGTMNL